MPREANAVDFWRGFALVSIFVNHIPGISYERLTHRNLSISDSAELFVFLAGWSLGLLVGSSDAQRDRAGLLAFRLGGRAVQIYAAQILISSLALALLAATAYFTRQPAHSRMAQRGRRSSRTRRTRRSASCCSRISSATSTSCRSTWCSCWWRRPLP